MIFIVFLLYFLLIHSVKDPSIRTLWVFVFFSAVWNLINSQLLLFVSSSLQLLFVFALFKLSLFEQMLCKCGTLQQQWIFHSLSCSTLLLLLFGLTACQRRHSWTIKCFRLVLDHLQRLTLQFDLRSVFTDSHESRLVFCQVVLINMAVKMFIESGGRVSVAGL